MDREISEQDRDALLTMFRLKDGAVPAHVAEVYWNFKHFKDVLDAAPLWLAPSPPRTARSPTPSRTGEDCTGNAAAGSAFA